MNTPTLDDRVARFGPTGSPDPDVLAHIYAEMRAHLDSPEPLAVPRTHSLRRHAVRWTAVAAGVAAALAITLLPGPGSPAAFASWTTIPDLVTPANAAQSTAACLRFISNFQVIGPDLLGASAVVAERRGDWTYTLLSSEGQGKGAGSVYECLLPRRSDLSGSIGASQAGTAASLRPTEASWSGGGSQEGWRSAWGHVGDEVERVTITRADGVVIDATVSHGYFAAWWPLPTADGSTMEEFTMSWYLGDGTEAGSQYVAFS